MREVLHPLRQSEAGSGGGTDQWQGMCLPHHEALCSSLTSPKEATKKQENYKNYIKTIERATKKKKVYMIRQSQCSLKKSVDSMCPK